ncbi:DUF2510 domain-containing protein [Microbacterium sp. No. 7]|uniref:DUF2510 domain-containing protein n=1 Tax=Microbacterium sp. No. 7 TaxID=1714373 RepID=UPI0006CFE5CB|nr:DUF2510 domain-containing protein [Microbacterium sp. No. 7]ALJ19593.1 hypothetical protein AOA12_06585 [Microbacterium sp. No. 7]
MSTPAGWYPDPADHTRARWWDGQQWSEQTAPTSALASPGAPTPAPRYGEYAPVPPVPPVHGSGPAVPTASSSLPAWPVAPQVAPVAQRRDIDTNTVWIWLSIVAAHLPIVLLFLIDWQGYIDAIMSLEAGTADPADVTAALTEWTAGVMGLSLLSYVFIAASIVFAFLDHRQLVARGVQKPFHWAFAFLTLVISIGVYVIGRTVIVRRQTGRGMGPLWGWIAAIVLVIVISVGWAMALTAQLFGELAGTLPSQM